MGLKEQWESKFGNGGCVGDPLDQPYWAKSDRGNLDPLDVRVLSHPAPGFPLSSGENSFGNVGSGFVVAETYHTDDEGAVNTWLSMIHQSRIITETGE